MTSEKKLSEGPIETNNDLKLTTNKVEYYVYLDSVLTGHESWVYSVRWSPTQLKLLSASLDKTLIIWKYCVDSQMWLEDLRFGEVGGKVISVYGMKIWLENEIFFVSLFAVMKKQKVIVRFRFHQSTRATEFFEYGYIIFLKCY